MPYADRKKRNTTNKRGRDERDTKKQDDPDSDEDEEIIPAEDATVAGVITGACFYAACSTLFALLVIGTAVIITLGIGFIESQTVFWLTGKTQEVLAGAIGCQGDQGLNACVSASNAIDLATGRKR